MDDDFEAEAVDLEAEAADVEDDVREGADARADGAADEVRAGLEPVLEVVFVLVLDEDAVVVVVVRDADPAVVLARSGVVELRNGDERGGEVREAGVWGDGKYTLETGPPVAVICGKDPGLSGAGFNGTWREGD